MSMCYSIYAASDESLSALFGTPELIHRFLGNPSPRPKSKQRIGIFARLFGGKVDADTTTVEKVTPNFRTDIEPCHLDKSWHGLHYLFTGSDWEGEPPQSFLLNWGKEIGEIDVGYGPARGLSSSQICAIHEFLETIDAMVLRKRFNTTKMEELEIYPNCWTRDPEAEFAYLVEFLEPLKDFICKIRQRKMGAVVQLA